MRKMLALLLCLLLPLTALAEGLPMYSEDLVWGSFPPSQPIRTYLSDFHCFYGNETVDLGLDQQLPVYAYPSEEGWRAAQGKASVSLKEPFTALAWSEDEQWLLIDYEIGSPNALGDRQHRIGYIRRDALPAGFRCPVHTENLIRVELQTSGETQSLRDDINGLQYPVASLPGGSTVTVLGYVNTAYAFVETELEGKPARLFLPLTALVLPEEQPDQDMMAALQGLWLFIGGGELLGDGCRFDGQGTMQVYAAGEYDNFPTTVLVTDEDSLPCEYRVYPNLLGEMRYPGADWVLETRQGDYVGRVGLTLSTDEEGTRCLDISQGEGGGGYRFVTDESIITFVQQ